MFSWYLPHHKRQNILHPLTSRLVGCSTVNEGPNFITVILLCTCFIKSDPQWYHALNELNQNYVFTTQFISHSAFSFSPSSGFKKPISGDDFLHYSDLTNTKPCTAENRNWTSKHGAEMPCSPSAVHTRPHGREECRSVKRKKWRRWCQTRNRIKFLS